MSACHGQTKEKNVAGSQGGEKAKAAVWVVMMPIRVHLLGSDTITLKAEPQVVIHLNLQQSFLLMF